MDVESAEKPADVGAKGRAYHKNPVRNRILVMQQEIGGAVGVLPPESEKPRRRVLQA